MGIRVERKKPRHWLLAAAYRLNKWFPGKPGRKLDFWLDLEWIAGRLAIEQSFRAYDRDEHPCHPDANILKYIEPTDRVLDLGCGDGHISKILAERAANVVGIDHNPEMIRQAQQNYPGITFTYADAFEYLRATEKFNVLVLSHILEHLDGPEVFLQRLKGHFERVYIEVPDFEATHLNQLRSARKRQLIYTDNDHVSEFDRAELKELFAKADLQILDEDYIYGVMRFWLSPS